MLPVRFFLILAIGSSSLVLSARAVSSDIVPLYGSNQSPLIQIYGLPSLGEARVLGKDKSSLALRFQVANNFTGASSASEYLVLDGESHRYVLSWREGLGNDWEWGFELPYLSHNGGFLDSSIERFHDATGLPQNGRTNVPRNQINYRYVRNGVELVNVSSPVNGVGDLRLQAAEQIGNTADSGNRLTALRISLKLPTGDETELLGSGGTDLAIWLSSATNDPGKTWGLYGGGGILMMSEGNVLPSQQRNQVLFGTLGLSWRLFSELAVNGQLDAHTSFYDQTDFRQLNSYAIQGKAGINWELAPEKYLEFSISEDVIVDTSSDVVFNLSLVLPF